MKRNKKTERFKKFFALRKEYEEYGWGKKTQEELEKPIHHGYYVEYVFDEKHQNRLNAELIRECIDNYFGYGWCENKTFTCFDKFAKKTVEIKPKRIRLTQKEFEGLNNKIKYLFSPVPYQRNFQQQIYHLNDEILEYVRTVITKAYITHRYVDEPEKKSFRERASDILWGEYRDLQRNSYSGKKFLKTINNRYHRREFNRKLKGVSLLEDFDGFETVNKPYNKGDYWF